MAPEVVPPFVNSVHSLIPAGPIPSSFFDIMKSLLLSAAKVNPAGRHKIVQFRKNKILYNNRK